jgi:general secretion pathway protein I
MNARKPSGFTLVEVLIALLIVSIALITASKAMMNAVDTSQDLKYRLLADWVAENRLEIHHANHDWLGAGLINLTFDWQEEVIDTPNPAFKKIIITVYHPNNPHYSLRRLVGFLERQPNP